MANGWGAILSERTGRVAADRSEEPSNHSVVATVPADRLEGFDNICRRHEISPVPRSPNGPHLFHFALRDISGDALFELRFKGLVT